MPTGPQSGFGLDQFSARHRDRRQLVHRPAAVHVGSRPTPAPMPTLEARAALDRARHQDVRDHADAQSQVAGSPATTPTSPATSRARSATSSTTAARRNTSGSSTTSPPRAMRGSRSPRRRGRSRTRCARASRHSLRVLYFLRMIFSENRYPLFRIMLQASNAISTVRYHRTARARFGPRGSATFRLAAHHGQRIARRRRISRPRAAAFGAGDRFRGSPGGRSLPANVSTNG